MSEVHVYFVKYLQKRYAILSYFYILYPNIIIMLVWSSLSAYELVEYWNKVGDSSNGDKYWFQL